MGRGSLQPRTFHGNEVAKGSLYVAGDSKDCLVTHDQRDQLRIIAYSCQISVTLTVDVRYTCIY